MLDVGFDYSLNSTLVASVRYTNRRLIRTIEDVGTLGADGEIYYIANPGEGLTVDPKTWDPGFPMTPKAVRDYDAVEVPPRQALRQELPVRGQLHLEPQLRQLQRPGQFRRRNGPHQPERQPLLRPALDRLQREGPMRTAVWPPTGRTPSSSSAATPRRASSATPRSRRTSLLYSGARDHRHQRDLHHPGLSVRPRRHGPHAVFHNFDLNLMHDFKPLKNHETMQVRFEFTVFNLFNSSTVTNSRSRPAASGRRPVPFANDADIFKGFNTDALMKAQDLRTDPLLQLGRPAGSSSATCASRFPSSSKREGLVETNPGWPLTGPPRFLLANASALLAADAGKSFAGLRPRFHFCRIPSPPARRSQTRLNCSPAATYFAAL